MEPKTVGEYFQITETQTRLSLTRATQFVGGMDMDGVQRLLDIADTYTR